MYGNCLKCEEDVGDLMDWDTLTEEYIVCPKCGNKMEVNYDESWDEESETEDSWWWLENYGCENTK